MISLISMLFPSSIIFANFLIRCMHNHRNPIRPPFLISSSFLCPFINSWHHVLNSFIPVSALDTRAKHKKFANKFQEIYCPMCNKKFHTKSGFLIHQTSHKKYYKACPFCKLWLATKFVVSLVFWVFHIIDIFITLTDLCCGCRGKLALKPPLASCDHDDSDEAAAEATVGHDG